MTDMPERIFATRAVNLNTCRAGTYRDIANDEKQRTEYIRADRVAALVEAAGNVLASVQAARDQGAPHKLSPRMSHSMAGLRAAIAALDANGGKHE
jgi:hypothetical protein